MTLLGRKSPVSQGLVSTSNSGQLTFVAGYNVPVADTHECQLFEF